MRDQVLLFFADHMEVIQQVSVIAKGQFELKYGFMVAASFADDNFGALTANLKRTQLSTARSTPK